METQTREMFLRFYLIHGNFFGNVQEYLEWVMQEKPSQIYEQKYGR